MVSGQDILFCHESRKVSILYKHQRRQTSLLERLYNDNDMIIDDNEAFYPANDPDV